MSNLMPTAMAVITLTGILLGYRVAFVLAGSSALFILISDLPSSFFGLISSRIYANVLTNWMLVSIPMFVFMGLMLEKSGVAERALRGVQRGLGGSPGGMGTGVLVIGVLLAASSGIVGASVVLLALLGLPRLLEAGYDRRNAAGLIASSGTLAILIPPSIMLVVLGDQLKVPIGDMFTAAIVPGLMLVLVYGVYVWWISRTLKGAGLNKKTPTLGSVAMDVFPLLALVIGVLITIVSGLATPTEASGLGALGASALALFHRRLSWPLMMAVARETVITTSMILLVMVGATCFSAVFHGIGGHAAIESTFGGVTSGAWILLLIIMGAIFLLGFVLDWLEITLILIPIFAPLIVNMDFGNGLEGSALLVWFGILIAVNLQTSFLTPPFGFSLFYLRGAAGESLSIKDIYIGVIPFILMQVLVLVLLAFFPELVVGFI